MRVTEDRPPETTRWEREEQGGEGQVRGQFQIKPATVSAASSGDLGSELASKLSNLKPEGWVFILPHPFPSEGHLGCQPSKRHSLSPPIVGTTLWWSRAALQRGAEGGIAREEQENYLEAGKGVWRNSRCPVRSPLLGLANSRLGKKGTQLTLQ